MAPFPVMMRANADFIKIAVAGKPSPLPGRNIADTLSLPRIASADESHDKVRNPDGDFSPALPALPHRRHFSLFDLSGFAQDARALSHLQSPVST